MRAFVLFLALLVALKIWVQDSVYRDATGAALVTAYRERAIAACGAAATLSSSSGRADQASDWSAGEEPRVVIGKPSVPVHFWQVDHELWDARFRHAYLMLGSGSGETCAYDLLGDTADIVRP